MVLTEESIRQSDSINALHVWIRSKVRVDIKEHRHIYRLSGIKFLLLKAETLDLAEIRSHLARSHTVRGYSNDILRALVRRCVECQRGFSWQHAHLSLLRCKFPWEHVRNGTIESDTETSRVCYGRHSGCGIAVAIAVGENWLTAPACLLADL